MAQSPTPIGLAADDYQNYDDTSFRLQSFPLSHMNKTHLENGNRIIMPASAIHSVMPRRKIKCPMTFEITNLDSGKNSHCGVVEFSAEDGCVYIPDWMMHALVLKDGQFVQVEKTGNLAKATYMKIQPHSTDFVKNLSDRQVMLEEILKDFVCVTAGDTVVINHEDQRYYIDIVATDPEDVVSLFDTDYKIDVMQPLDYEEPPEQVKTEEGATQLKELEADFAKLKPFTGVSRQLCGKISTNTTNVVAKIDSYNLNGMTEFDVVVCSPNSGGTDVPCSDSEEVNRVGHENEGKKFQPFTGRKYTLSGS
ncbi:Ubiquitin fusion degradation 1 [Heracleum sosnowskyi]|uniref:Ubiquitin fusion degradation 1 n=1 Tax=Heracleum sosnowskyi TaxID=360622 RepID=A0AAD8HHV2_9APIA|nr:Ubiquitin fusion degradation 1 [Heracleum sosnowskyi]